MESKKIITVVVLLILSLSVAFSTSNVLDVKIKEYVNQNVIYAPLKNSGGIWYDTNENQSKYNLTGYIIVKNVDPDNLTISDIYVEIKNTSYISLPQHYAGRNGTFVVNNTNNYLLLHIPELQAGQNSTWVYSINRSAVKPPLNFTSHYSDTKVLAGQNLTVMDTISNDFINRSYQNPPCIYDINITERTIPVNFSGFINYFYFIPKTINGTDASNVTFSSDNQTLYWHALAGRCLNYPNADNISYFVKTPYNIPATTFYRFINATLRYKLNNTISYIRVTNIRAASEANIATEKKIIGPSHPVLYGSNVTWNITAYFYTTHNITYNLSKVTLWVAKRISGATNPNVIDNDSISGKPLNITFTPFFIVNKTSGWTSPSWLFNYSDLPSPAVFNKAKFSILNDGVQLQHRSVTQNGRDIYIKEIYMIIGYWLEINKNVTFLGNNTYHIHVYVHNKGNQVTPANSVVMIYDFVPKGFNLTSNFDFSNSPWYNTTWSNYSVNGNLTGELYQFALMHENVLNTSLAAGPVKNENTTWTVDYNITGKGNYKVTDIFVTGLDPMRVDGAGSTRAVIISEIIEKAKSKEGIFAIISSVLLLLSILI